MGCLYREISLKTVASELAKCKLDVVAVQESRDSSVSIGTRLRPGRPRFNSRHGP
jgi:hypothetical protein